MDQHEPIHITIPGDLRDPRGGKSHPAGVLVHRVPHLDPADVTVVDGIPVTTVSRTLIDLAEVAGEQELREVFATAEARGLLDLRELEAARARVEWRPSLAMFDRVMAEFR
ncbi:MAG: hypothetical protein ACR2NA_05770 [Solirubrobacterales bacterium]